MFDVAIYTDTRANEAIDGIDGFNFQAISEGITAQDRQVIRSNMLHRVVVGWNVEHDPLDHPASFAYYGHSGRYYLSRGISTGVTNNGRPGNLLTEAIVTSDPDDFGMMRPAQLLGATSWRLKKAPSQTLNQWSSPLEVDPGFEAEALQAMIKANAWAASIFPKFLTMVEEVTDPAHKRLIIITADAALAMKWVALATLFIETSRSLSLSIRGLVADPMTTRADIVAASPDFGPQPDPSTPRAGVNIIDLDRRAIAEVTPSESALIQANWFLNEDSATALAAIDVARRWEEYLGRDLATRAASLASFPKTHGDHTDWLTATQALHDLAEAEQEDELFFYGDTLLDIAVTCALSTPEDAQLAGNTVVALIQSGSHDLASGLLMSALESACASPHLREALLETLTTAPAQLRLDWEDESAKAQASLLLSQVAAESADSLLPAVLTTASVIGTPLVDSLRPQLVARTARLWASNPELTEQCEQWEHVEEIIEQLAHALVKCWCAGGQDDLRLLMQGTWAWLATSPALTTTSCAIVGQWNVAAELAKLPTAECTAQLQTAGQLPPDSWRLLFGQAKLPENYKFFIAWAQTQRELSVEAGRWLLKQIFASLATGEPLVELRQLLICLNQSGIGVCDKRLRAYAAQVVTATKYCRDAAAYSRRPNPYLSTVLTYIPAMSPLMPDFLGQIILTSPDAVGVSHLVGASETWARKSVHYFLSTRPSTVRETANAVTWALKAMHGPLESPSKGAEDFLVEVSDDRARRGLVSQAAKENLINQQTFGAFENFVKEAKKGRLKRKLTKAASGLLNIKGQDN